MAFTKQPQYRAPLAAFWRAKAFAVNTKSAMSLMIPGGREMVFSDTNAIPTLFGVTPTRTVTRSGITISWAGDAHYEMALPGVTADWTMLVVVASFQAGTASSICGGRNNSSAAYAGQVLVNSSGFYELYEDATLKATGTVAALPGDVLVIVRSGGGTLTTVYTPYEVISSGAVSAVSITVMRLGRTGRVATGTKGIALFVGFTGTMESIMARSLVMNPWQVFQSPAKRARVGITAAGGSFQAAWAVNSNVLIQSGMPR